MTEYGDKVTRRVKRIVLDDRRWLGYFIFLTIRCNTSCGRELVRSPFVVLFYCFLYQLLLKHLFVAANRVLALERTIRNCKMYNLQLLLEEGLAKF